VHIVEIAKVHAPAVPVEPALEEAVALGKETKKASASKAASWREQIAAIRDQAKT
jgi:hypothetical protein